LSENAADIINRSSLDEQEKALVFQIIKNYHIRGLLWKGDDRDETIATTECIVLTNCLRKLWQERQSQGNMIPCQHDWDKGVSGPSGNRTFTCKKCGRQEIDD
jgi:hypothetical protein